MSTSAIPSSLRYWYGASLPDFIAADSATVLGELTKNCSFSLQPTQRDAWLVEIEILRAQLKDLSGTMGQSGTIFLEFNIPRMGRRIDAVLLIGPCVFAVEFKVGQNGGRHASGYDRAAIDQVWDYALDLKNFHEASHGAPIVPILIPTESTDCPEINLHADADNVFRPVCITPAKLRLALDSTMQLVSGAAIDAQAWAAASYHPTPTIVEAARALYAQHSVEAIARFDADAQNLHTTSGRIEELVEHARAEKRKVICFVTGVPGAGKTLVGLNLATRREADEPTHAVFLSGNGPLVAVLREALTRDEVARLKTRGEKPRKSKIGESVKAFIQNVHHFRDDALIDSNPPIEHVVIFDEAQRACSRSVWILWGEGSGHGVLR